MDGPVVGDHETGIRNRVRGLIEEMICVELDAALSRPAMVDE
jgi:hypothetical protein